MTTKMPADNFSVLITDNLMVNKTASRYDNSYIFPLYLYPTDDSLETDRQINFDPTNAATPLRQAQGGPGSGQVSKPGCQSGGEILRFSQNGNCCGEILKCSKI